MFWTTQRPTSIIWACWRWGLACHTKTSWSMRTFSCTDIHSVLLRLVYLHISLLSSNFLSLFCMCFSRCVMFSVLHISYTNLSATIGLQCHKFFWFHRHDLTPRQDKLFQEVGFGLPKGQHQPFEYTDSEGRLVTQGLYDQWGLIAVQTFILSCSGLCIYIYHYYHWTFYLFSAWVFPDVSCPLYFIYHTPICQPP